VQRRAEQAIAVSEERGNTISRPDATAPADPVERNISDIVALQKEELAALGPAQRRLEVISRKVAQPAYLVGVVVFILAWIGASLLSLRLGGRSFDPPPFEWLQGLITFTALLTATVVLIGQSRQMRLAEQRAHLDLQISLLTEEKVTKLIHLLEELRRDLPVRDRHDPHVAVLQQHTDAGRVLSALKDAGLAEGETKGPQERE
jgi:uncharacterized membrane protein